MKTQKVGNIWHDPGPDKGWSFVTLGACWLFMIFTFGLCRTGAAGVFYIEFLTVFGVTRKEASWPFSILGITECIVGLTTGFLTQTVNLRLLMCVSAVSCTLGLVVCFWATDLFWISMWFGILFGFGESLSSTACVVYLNQFFDKYLATANGIMLSATPVSGFILPVLMTWIIDQYGLRGGMLLAGGMASQMIIAGVLLRPRKPSSFPILDESRRLRRKMSSALDILELHEELERMQQVSAVTTRRRRISDAMITYRHVLWQPMFYVVTAHSVACISAQVGLSLTLVDYAIDNGYSKGEGVLLLTMYSLASLVGRLVTGYVSDRGFLQKKTVALGSVLLMAICMILLPLANSFAWLMALTMMVGIAEGCGNTLINVLYKYYIGSRGLSTSVGLRLFTNGCFSFARPIIAGYFRDTLGTYVYFYYMMGSVSIASAILWLAEPFFIRNIKDDIKEVN